VVDPAIILTTQEVEHGRTAVQGQPREKVLHPSQPMAGNGGMCLSVQLHGEAQMEGSWFRLAPV
jgi:hypothetical protein